MPSLAANVTVTIRLVANENQLPPVWIGNNYTITVREDIPVKTLLVELKAESQLANPLITFGIYDVAHDGPESNVIYFRTSDGPNQGKTQVNNLELSSGLDYEVIKEYTVTVRASVSVI